MDEYIIKQDLRKYTKLNHEIWEHLFTNQHRNLEGLVPDDFYRGLKLLKFTRKKIPKFSDINDKLISICNFEIVGVNGIVPDDVFFEMLSKRKFPVTIWIRMVEQMDYIEEPDIFHDLFGHVPYLVNKNYANFLQKIGEAGLNYKDDEEKLAKLVKLYWYTIEFGLIQKPNKMPKILGSGIISSMGETNKALSGDTEILPYSEELLEVEFRKDIMQEFYASIKSIDELNNINLKM
jgi:phenylalanine-4-hydroxylase